MRPWISSQDFLYFIPSQKRLAFQYNAISTVYTTGK